MNKLIIKALILSAGIIVNHTDAGAQKYKSGAAYSGIVLPVKNGSVAADIKSRALSKNDVVQNLNGMLGLSAKHTFKQIKETTDKLGITHTNMQQYYQGVKVEGGMVLVHSKNGQVNYINGKIAQLRTLSIQPVLKEKEAFNNAQKSMLVKKTIRQYPVELVIASVPSSSIPKDYALAYKARVDGKTAKGNIVMANVFVDAVTGKILKTINLMADADVAGTANTLYSGVRPLIMDSFAGGYRLRDNARNIQTYNGGAAGDSLGNVNWNIDYVNNNTHWDLFNTLSAVTLQTASPALITGINVDRLVFFNLSETAPQTQYGQNSKYVYFAGQPSPPVVNDGLRDILDPAKSYYGTYINLEVDTVQYTFNTTNSASYSLANISAGTHSWADTAGNSGNYTVSMQKNPAVDVHWGMGKTHDFYSNVMSRNSYNDSGSVIRNYVNAGLANNAGAYPEPYNFMVYGMGDGYAYNPFVSIDVMGHEFTHMVTGHTAGLEYQGESGALNESFSDIFGTSIEFYAKGADANWIIGEGIMLGGLGFFRSMADPKLAQNPDTYEGQYWMNTSPDSTDRGGVHFNSGVQNKWFYLLSQGGSGTNDKGDAYTVTGIGIAKAQQIAYHNLTNYLTPQSQYIDAYTGSLQATKDLYGDDTTKQEYRSVREAWYAVGIGEKPAPPTAVNEIMVNNDDLKLYPNPATGRVTISSNLLQTLDAQIINVVGVPVMNITVSKGLNPVDISTLAKGVYMIRYNTGVQGYVQKLSVL